MKIFPHLFDKLFCQPLMILESVRFSLESSLLEHMGMATAGPAYRSFGQPGEADEKTIEWMKMREETKRSWRIEQIYQTYGNVAVVNIAGVIDKHLSNADLDCYGGCDLADVDKALMIAEQDPKIERIVLAINSPGGSVQGVPETAARVARLRQSKEVRSYVDGMSASAAFYIGSQADHIDVTPSSQIGSVGVYCTILDRSRELDLKGVKVELIKAGKYKAMGSPFKPLIDEEREMIQTRVTRLHNEFREAVNGSRPQVKLDDMEGQCFDGRESVARGLADATTTLNLDEYISRLLME